MPRSIQSRIARGATWMLFFKLVDRGLAFVSTIVLARLLVPADFGLVAMAMSVMALIELASAFGFEVPLIQRTDPSRAHYDTAWTLRLMFGLFCGLATAALALPTAAFYGDPRLTLLMLVLSTSWLIESLENIGTVNFRRELDFRREFIFMLSKRLSAVAVTLAAALATQSYWALIAGTLTGRAVGLVLSYTMQSYRPRLSLAAWRELFGFSGWLFVTNVLGFLNARLSHFVIGRTQGAAPLGVFTIATDIAALASSEITAPINRAVMPGLSRWAEQSGGVAAGLLQISATLQFITMPAAFGLAAVAHPLVETLLGDRWLAAVVPVQILAFAGALQSLVASNYAAYLAAARAHVPAMASAAFVCALVPLLYLLHDRGIDGVALAHLGAMAASVSVSLGLMRRYLGVSPFSLFAAALRPLVAATIMGLSVWLAVESGFGLPPDTWPVVLLLLGVASGFVIYVGLVGLMWLAAGRPAGPETMLLERLRLLRDRAET